MKEFLIELFPPLYSLCEESADFLALVAAEGVVQEREAEADDGPGEEATKDELLLDLDLGRRPGEKKCGEAGKRDHTWKSST